LKFNRSPAEKQILQIDLEVVEETMKAARRVVRADMTHHMG
jgi:hypothetical protein